MSTNSIVMPNDLSDLCRVCLQLPEESQYLDMTTIYDEDDNLTYGECFRICTQIDLNAGHGVPKQLCKSCGLELQMSYDFHKKVEESKRVLQQYEKQMLIDDLPQSKLLMEPQVQQEQQNKELEQQQNNAEPHTNDCETFLMSDIVAEDAPTQSQETLDLEYDQEYTLNTETEMNAVDIMLKVSPVKSTQNVEIDVVRSDHVEEGVEIEEHLEIDDFQNLEALDEETETLQIKCDENVIPTQIIKYNNKENQEENVHYEDEEEVEDDEISQTNSQELHYDDECNRDLTWQENVVAVANKEHLPVETEEEDEEEGEETYYAKEEDYLILEETEDDDDDNELLKVEREQTTKKENSNFNNNSKTRKRHVGIYSCDYCQKPFPNYSRMVTHRRCHEADRPKYTCEYCGRMYATKQAKQCHVQTAHKKSGFTCDICGKVYAIRKSLEIHIRYHTGDFPFACDLCDKKFAQACHLTTHKNVKHNSVRFSCDYPNCGKFFTSSTSLRSHEYSHGLMPFECEHCEMGYPSKSKLKVHIKRKHGLDLNKDQLESMRKFHVMRSKLNLVQVVEVEEQ